MKFVSLFLILIAAVICNGCTTLPITVTNAYTVPAGENVGLVALTNTTAMVAEVEVDWTKIKFPAKSEAQASFVMPTIPNARMFLVIGAERVSTNAVPGIPEVPVESPVTNSPPDVI